MGGRPVLFVSYSGALGGAERVLLDCATRLGRPVLVACPDGALADAARVAALPVAPLCERSPRLRGAHAAAAGALAGFAYEVARVVRRSRPAVVAAWSARAVLASALLPPGPKFVAVHHDFPTSRPVAAALRAANRRAARVIATSGAVARSLGGAAVLAPGVDLDAWRPAPMPASPAPRALVLGALVPWKRADLALEIAARVPELHLTIAGAPLEGANEALGAPRGGAGRPAGAPLEPADRRPAAPRDGGAPLRAAAFEARLRRRADSPDLRGRVEFAGALDDPRAAVAAAHVLLHCADAEPWGLVLLEALATGRKVVAPAAGGPLEILTPDAGLLYAPGDPVAGAAALREVLAAPDPAAARRRAEAFPVEASAARFAEAIA